MNVKKFTMLSFVVATALNANEATTFKRDNYSRKI